MRFRETYLYWYVELQSFCSPNIYSVWSKRAHLATLRSTSSWISHDVGFENLHHYLVARTKSLGTVLWK